MTTGFSVGILNGWLDTLEGTAFTAPAGFWVQLHIGDPGAAGTANAASVTTRRQVTAADFNAASGGIKSTVANPVQWINWAGSSEKITHVSFWSEATGTVRFLGSGAAGVGKDVVAGDTLRMTALSFTITPVAA